MKKINYVKFALDLLMGIVFALFFNHRILGGLMYHETAGLAIGAAIVIHLIFNHTWIHKITAALFQKGLPLKTRIGWIVDFLLLIDMFVMILAGISISKVLLPDLIPQVGILNRNTHIALACTDSYHYRCGIRHLQYCNYRIFGTDLPNRCLFICRGPAYGNAAGNIRFRRQYF